MTALRLLPAAETELGYRLAWASAVDFSEWNALEMRVAA
jgi:hypothetical protein